MTARMVTSDGLAPLVDDLAVDHEVGVEAASDLARTAQHALLAHAQALGDRAAPQVFHPRAQLDAMETLALVAARHQRLGGARDEPPTHERLVQPEPQLADIV